MRAKEKRHLYAADGLAKCGDRHGPRVDRIVDVTCTQCLAILAEDYTQIADRAIQEAYRAAGERRLAEARIGEILFGGWP